MASILLLGSNTTAAQYIDIYIKEKKIADYNIDRLDGVKVEDVRGIKKKLSFRSSGDRLFFITGEITIEAQNALLKSVEEHAPTTHFIFASQKEDDLLPTIRSRCLVVRLEQEAVVSHEIERLIALYFSKDAFDWDTLEKIINEISDMEPEVLLPILRDKMIADLDHGKNVAQLYNSCKKMLSLLPLVSKNNVSTRTFVERSLISNDALSSV